MKRICAGFFALAILLFSASARAGLTEDLQALIQDKAFAKANLGVQVVRLGDQAGESKVLFRHDSDIPLMPASNLKLVTTSAALEKLGPDFKFRTVLAKRGDDLILIGDGDPTFGDGEAMKRVGWETTSVFKQWIELLKTANVTSINSVLIDDSIFDQTFYQPNWDPKQYLENYRAEVAGMNLNLNLLDFYVRVTSPGQVVDYSIDPPTQYVNILNQCVTGGDKGVWFSRDQDSNALTLRGEVLRSNTTDPISITIHDPPLYAGRVFADLCKASGITVKGKVSRDREIRRLLGKDSTITPVAVYETPIANVLARANKDSVNLYAECLCKRLGAATTGQSGSWTNGTAAMSAFLKSVGVSESEFSFDDGCGLSRKNGISANAICQVLEHDYFSSNRDAFVTSMAVGGVDGRTLKKRFTDELKGRVLAKTGYIRGVSCLSGFLKAQDGSMLAFSVLINNIYTDDARKLQDKIVKVVDRNAVVRSTSINP